LLTVSKGKRKAAPTRARVYAAVTELVSVLLKSSSICANTFAYSVTDASHGRRSWSVSRICTSDAARSVKWIRVGALRGGRVARLSRGRSQLLQRGLRGNWCPRWTSRRVRTRCR
jgi:hypothetical protein